MQTTRDAIWNQLGAAIDMLDNAMEACPDDLWRDEQKLFWYGAYHALFWLDFYVSGGPEDFAPPEPFGVEEKDPAGVMPPRVYEKRELREYARYVRERCRQTVNMLTDDNGGEVLDFGFVRATRVEMAFYNARHVQHHAAQLNLLLRQAGAQVPGYVKYARPSP